jgi:hypothetical protein
MRTTKNKTFISIILITLSALIISPTFAQTAEDSTDGRFHDDLLNHLVGKWDVAAMVHGQKFTLNLEAEWVLDHQHLHIHYKSHEVVPWLKIPFEGESFFAYNHANQRYTVHEMTVHGGDGPYEGFCYAYETGNEFKLMQKWAGSDTLTAQRFTWEPLSKSWHITAKLLVDGKEGESFIDMKLVAAKPSSN